MAHELINNRYQLLELIGIGGIGEVYKAEDLSPSNRRTVVLKFFQTSESEENAGAGWTNLKREISITARMNHPHIVKMLDFGLSVKGRYLVMEYAEGPTLKEKIVANELQIKEIMQIFVGITKGLNHAHALGIIHGDLKPQNIIIENQTGYPKILDFGLSYFLGKRQGKESSVSGTLDYKAPESLLQKADVSDIKTELWSLGVIGYEMLFSDTPFKGMEVLRTGQVPEINYPSHEKFEKELTSQAYLKIIRKLLDSEPSARYANTDSLLKDLIHVKTAEENNIDLIEFQPGSSDREGLIAEEMPFHGRTREISVLQKSFSDATRNMGSLLVLSGPSGIGKSRMVEEFQKTIDSKALVLSAIGYESTRQAPFLPFRTILSELAFFLKTSHRQLDYSVIIEDIKHRLGDNIAILIDLCPELEDVLGSRPELQSLAPKQEKERFYNIVSDFLLALARDSFPLVILFDGLHNFDSGSLALLEMLLLKIKELPVLIIASETVSDEKYGPVYLGLKKSTQLQSGILRLCCLEPITRVELKEMIDSLLKVRVENEETLISKLLSVSQGLPILVRELLTSFRQHGALYREGDKWHFNPEKLPENYVSLSRAEIIRDRIFKLSDTNKELLFWAALIETAWSVNFMTSISGLTADVVSDFCEECLSLNLLVSVPDGYRFIHDLIRKAVIEIIPPETRIQMHAKIGSYLERTSKIHSPVNTFRLAHHFNESQITDKALFYNIRAGRTAAEAQSAADACQYISRALGLIEKWNAPIQKKQALKKYILKFLGDLQSLNGNFAESIQNYEQALQMSASKLEKSTILARIGTVQSLTGNFDKSVKSLRAALAIHGVKLPSGKIDSIFSIAFQLLRLSLSALKSKKKKKMKRRDWLIQDILNQSTWTLYFYNHVQSLAAQLKALNMTPVDINHPHVMTTLYFHSGVAGTAFLHKRAESFVQRAFEMSLEMEDRNAVSQSLVYKGLGNLFLGKRAVAEQCFREVINLYSKTGNVSHKILALVNLGIIEIYQGKLSRAGQRLEEARRLSDLVNDDMNKVVSRQYLIIASLFSGDTRRVDQLLRDALKASKNVNDAGVVAGIYRAKAMIEMSRNQSQKALNTLSESCRIIRKNGLAMVYTADIFANLAEYELNDESLRRIKRSKKPGRYLSILRLCFRALIEGKRFPDLKGYSLRSLAHLFDKCNAMFLTRMLFKKAIAAFKDQELHLEAAVTSFQYGCFLEKIDENASVGCFMNAITDFKSFGAWAYYRKTLAKLKKRNLNLLNEKNEDERKNAIDKTKKTIDAILNISLSMHTMMKPGQILERIIDSVLEIMQAERGFIILKTDATVEGISEKFEVKVARNIEKNILNQEEFKFSQGVINSVFTAKKPLVIDDAQADPKFAQQISVMDFRLLSILCVPMIYKDKLLGIIYLDNNREPNKFTREDAKVLTGFAAQAAVIIENSRLLENIIQSKQQWEMTFDSINDSIAILNPEGYILRVNSSTSKILNKEYSNIVFKHYSKIFPFPENSDQNAKPHEAILKTKKSVTQEIKGKDGKYYSISVSPIFDQKGELTSMVQVMRDISDEVALREKLQQSDKLATLGRVIASVGHELKNGMMGIESTAKFCLDQNIEDDSRRWVKLIYKQSQKLRYIIEAMRYGTNPQPPNFKREDINALIRNLIKTMNEIGEVPMNYVRLNLSANLPEFEFDSVQIEQVLKNLVKNAYHAILTGVRNPLIKISTRLDRKSENCLIEISDNGPGIPEKIQEKIFRPFFTTKDHEKGSGLGLYISRTIIENHDGSLNLKNMLRGAMFSISLPLRNRTEPLDIREINVSESNVVRLPENKNRKKGAVRILIVADSQVKRQKLLGLLTERDYRVDVADGFENAFRKIRNKSYDSIISDMQLSRNELLLLNEKFRTTNPDMQNRFIFIIREDIKKTEVNELQGQNIIFISNPLENKEIFRALDKAVGF